jgi:hypothetical protein
LKRGGKRKEGTGTGYFPFGKEKKEDGIPVREKKADVLLIKKEKERKEE